MKIKFYFLMGIGGIKKDDRGVTATMIYCKKFCKGYNVQPVQ
jgi:hypothetical protein